MAEVDLTIAGRPYRVACRAGEEDSLRAAAALVDAKSREALAGLGTMSEARQLLFASLLLADQLVDQRGPENAGPDPRLAQSANALASRLEALADALESEAQTA
ncbi:cell division protein ZapA [Sphingomonas sp.]|uniref:cell division protein ZapA n=1 Tax=Sphingomonas sp. TaxID=28214 RepID=UPI0017D3A865|nr:cell division protein ZapA [Sphingomonas sp.]MBA3512142.1 cell division protein ZapA [Sphingomonas sp.]